MTRKTVFMLGNCSREYWVLQNLFLFYTHCKILYLVNSLLNPSKYEAFSEFSQVAALSRVQSQSLCTFQFRQHQNTFLITTCCHFFRRIDNQRFYNVGHSSEINKMCIVCMCVHTLIFSFCP